MSKKDKKDKELKDKKEKKLKKNKKAESDDFMKDSIKTVHADELAADSRTKEKMAESDDKPDNDGIDYIETEKAPAAIGPYSQAVVSGNFLFASGQIPINPKNGEIDGDDISTQTRRVCKNIGKILKKAGTDFDHVVKTTCFLADMEDFIAFNEVYGEFFVSKPARSCVAVKDIPKGVRCEIEVVAYLGE